MGARSRKRRRGIAIGEATFTPRAEDQRPPRVRGEARNEQIRHGIVALAPGERPRPLVVGVVVALLLAVLNVVLLVAGYDVRGGQNPKAGGVLLFTAVMLVAAGGMWQRRYWAVLGFECLLAITCVFAAAALLVASNVRAVVLCLLIIGGAGWLFWKLVRVMARMQAPRRPGA